MGEKAISIVATPIPDLMSSCFIRFGVFMPPLVLLARLCLYLGLFLL